MTYSLFQGNPKYYRIIDGIRDFEQMPWLTTRYAKDMAPGDGVLIWKAGDKAGIYAIAEIIESSKNIENPTDIGYWIDTSRAMNRIYSKIRNTCKLRELPLLREDLKQDPVLKTLMVIRQPNATNYKVIPFNFNNDTNTLVGAWHCHALTRNLSVSLYQSFCELVLHNRNGNMYMN